MAKRKTKKGKKTKQEPSLLDVVKGLGKSERKPSKPKVKPKSKPNSKRVVSKPPKVEPERRAPKVPSNDRYWVLFRRLGPKDESIPAEVEAGDVVTFYGRDGASRTRIVESIAGQMVRMAELTAILGGKPHVVTKAESVNLGHLIEVLRPKDPS